MTTHPHAKRLIYAADMTFEKDMTVKAMIEHATAELDRCCEAFDGLGITIKGNTIFRLLGATALLQLEKAKCDVFGDYKLFDVQSTCINDGSWLQNIRNLEILTVNADVHPNVFTKFAEMLPNTIVAPIKPLTDLTDEVFESRGEANRASAVRKFFQQVMQVQSNGAICSPKDLELAPSGFQTARTIITPGIRPLYTFVSDDTNAVNALTPQKAIFAGSDRLVVGSPVRFRNQMRRNAIRILDEIGAAVEEKAV
ncbi:MAG: orotidine-5'-phosphate decarboxylase [Acidimicrobiales bacterium]|jgi:orotidine-5'-phosphate decarboxylase